MRKLIGGLIGVALLLGAQSGFAKCDPANNASDAADVAAVVGARIAVPIHWGTLYPRRLKRLWTGPLVQPGDRFAAAAARVAPATEVHVLRPGDRTVVLSS